MRFLGDEHGGEAFKVEVVLHGRVLDAAQSARLHDALAVRMSASSAFGERAGPDVSETWSYDMSPPDGSIGVALWVVAPTAGQAIDVAAEVVTAEVRRLVGDNVALWDVRAIPIAAISEAIPSPHTTVYTRRRRRWFRS